MQDSTNGNELPEGWAIAKFEDLLDYIQPTEYIVASTEYDDKYKTPVLTAGKSFIKGYTNETNGIFDAVPVIIFDDFTTATQFVNFPFKVKSSAMKILKPTCDLVNIKLAFYFMQTVHLKSETHKRYWISEYSKLPIPLPPQNEQKRIFDKIEEHLIILDKGIESLKAAQQQLKVYRQAVLKWAFEGKLTNENVVDGELPQNWKWKNIVDVVDKISDGPFGSNLKTEDYVGKGIRVIRLENIGELEFKDEYKSFVTKEKYETIKKHTVTKGDIIFSSFIIGSIRTVILPDYIDKAINKADCFSVKTSKAKINRKYLVYYFATKAMHNQLVNEIHGATRPRINTTQLKATQIPFAPIKEQTIIVQEIESRLSVCDKIEEAIETSLLQSEALRLSIIKKGFDGKLVKQNPKDEPAEILLAKIRAEKLSESGLAGLRDKQDKKRKKKIANTEKNNHELSMEIKSLNPDSDNE